MKYVVLVVPGMSDVPHPVLSGRTPLQAANLPAFDRLASRGRFGSVQVVAPNAPSGSVAGLPALLGYDPSLELRRGPLEAAGLGISLGAADMALRLNFVSTFRGAMADTRAGHITDREARVLLKALVRVKTPLDLTIHVGFGYRHLVVVHGGAGLELGTVPPQDVQSHPLKDYYPYGGDAEPFVRFLSDAAEILAQHDVNRVRVDLGENPADAIWLWGEGADQDVPSFGARLRLRASMVAAAPLARGLGLKAGMAAPTVPGATGDQNTSVEAKRAAVLEELQRSDFVMVHVAAANEAARAADAKGKVRALTRIDRDLVGPLLQWVEAAPGERRLLLTSDHQTLVDVDSRGNDPVPFALYGSGLEGVRDRPFTERAARTSDLKFDDAPSLLEFFLGSRARGTSA